MSKVLDFFNVFKHFGSLPPEYDRRVHGYYDPARFYGKPDTPLAQVKLGELVPWILRRNWSPVAMIRCCSRCHWRWLHRFYFSKKSGSAFIYQYVFSTMIFFYVLNIRKILKEKNYKYH